MSLLDAVIAAGPAPVADTPQAGKKRYSEVLSRNLAWEVADGLRQVDEDVTAGRTTSTFQRATRLLSTISGRDEYTGPGEKFENVALMLYQPSGHPEAPPWVRLVDADTGAELSEGDYYLMLRDLFNARNPHASLGGPDVAGDDG